VEDPSALQAHVDEIVGAPPIVRAGGTPQTSPGQRKRRPDGYEYGTTAWTATARKPFRCDDRGDRAVVAGQRYVRMVAFPGTDVNSSDRPWVLRVCEACATRYGRPMPPTRGERR
jgi:hypothetical protein